MSRRIPGRVRVLRVVTPVGVAGLSLGGFVLSFDSLRALAIASGVAVALAFIWPLIVDGFIVVAMAAAFELRGRGRASWYPWTALTVFSAISVTGNALHPTDAATHLGVPIGVAAVVSAVPAVALIVSSHLMVVMASAHRWASTPVASATAETDGPPELDTAQTRTPEPAAAIAIAATVSRESAAPVPAPATPAAELVDELERRVREGETVTGSLIGELLGVSDRTGRRRMDELRVSHPHLFSSTSKDAPR